MEDQNTFTETSTESWGARIMGSISSVLVGIALFLAAFIVLWFNEGRAVKTSKGLDDGLSQVVSVDANKIDQVNSGKLIHLVGEVKTTKTLEDNEFGISTNALKLKRSVQMFQWTEKKESKKDKNMGGSEKTTSTYKYTKEWSSSLLNSSEFKVQANHTNPHGFPFGKYTKTTDMATLGEFKLSKSLLYKLGGFEYLPLNGDNIKKLENAQIITEGADNSVVNKVFIGKGSVSEPQIGDTKVFFEVVKSGGDYSMMARQIKNTFEPFTTTTGSTIEIIESGVKSSDTMFSSAQSRNSTLTWILRVVGFFMMTFGLSLIFKPLVILADVLPILGSLLDMGLLLISGLISFAFSFTTIAIAWIFHRPFLGVSLLVIGIAIGVFLYMRTAKKKKEAIPA